MCNVKDGPCIGEYGCMLEMVCSDRAKQLEAERSRKKENISDTPPKAKT